MFEQPSTSLLTPGVDYLQGEPMNKPIVLVACTVACSATAEPPQPLAAPPPMIRRNPPSPGTVDVPPQLPSPTNVPSFTPEPFGPVQDPPLNPKIDGKQVHRGNDQTCFVYGVFAPDNEPRIPGMLPPQLPVECPPEMNDAVYDLCSHGSVYQTGSKCGCVVPGNPPPPARTLSRCPGEDIEHTDE